MTDADTQGQRYADEAGVVRFLPETSTDADATAEAETVPAVDEDEAT